MRMAGNRMILAYCLCMTGSLLGQHGSHGTPPAAQQGKVFPTDVAGLNEVTLPSEVSLEEGAYFVLEAKPAKQKVGAQWIRRLAYNGSIPGPIFRVKQGSSITIALKNGTDAPTTLHPHGLRIGPKSDGVPGVGQAPIQPGESYNYELTFPDAGVYWHNSDLLDGFIPRQ